MYEQIRAMYESGEIDRILRYCGVRAEDFDDLKQEVAVLLLETPPGKIRKLGEYTISLINRQYHSTKSRWWKKEGRWKKCRRKLPPALSEIPDEPGRRHLGRADAADAEDVRGHRKALPEPPGDPAPRG